MGQVAQPTFNPVASTSSQVPKQVTTTFTAPTNTQVPIANDILTESGGIVLTEGTGVLTHVN